MATENPRNASSKIVVRYPAPGLVWKFSREHQYCRKCPLRRFHPLGFNKPSSRDPDNPIYKAAQSRV
ncbi:hypothetical protein J6590_034445 [Homalodisca vitripennis]|nr:hypothetical protein J6590_034445 [Homalodisca vitripennis]